MANVENAQPKSATLIPQRLHVMHAVLFYRSTMTRHPQVPRRQFIAGAIGSVLLSALPARLAHAQLQPDTLRAAAQRTGLFWGAAVQSQQIEPGADFATAVVRECSIVVPEWEMKWGAIEPEKGRRNFARSDALLRFARSHHLKIRGTTLVWHRNIPKWADEALKGDSDWPLVDSHITATLKRYSDDSFIHWDAVNEPLEPTHGRTDGLREGPYLNAFGPDYIPRTLALAHEHAPKVRLYINEYGLDYDGSIERNRRAALLRLIETLKKQNAPLHGIGIQAHLRLDNSPFSESALRRFLSDIADHNLEITLTELDVRERNLSLPVEQRDRRVADEVKRYLDVVLDEPAVAGVVTWGLSDRYSWLNAKLPSGVRNRGLPFDEALEPKQVKYEMVAALQRRDPAK